MIGYNPGGSSVVRLTYPEEPGIVKSNVYLLDVIMVWYCIGGVVGGKVTAASVGRPCPGFRKTRTGRNIFTAETCHSENRGHESVS